MSDIAIKVENVSKTFRIPHEKISSLKGEFVNVYKKKGYEEFKALDNVSFEIKKGEFFGIIGRNGSGKSTLLKILAGIYQPDKGKVSIHGEISPFLELGIGFNPDLSGRDNIYLNASILGMSKKEIDEKFNTIVAFSELERFIDQQLKNYSSGMKVRLAFSVAIHANKDILLMDEVLAVGDSNFQKKCINTFRNYHLENKTVILVTHDISSVRKYCNRALLLDNGKIETIGDVDKVCDDYIVKNMTAGARMELLENEKDRKNEALREKELKLKHKPQVIMSLNAYSKDKKHLISLTRNDSFIVEMEVFLKEIPSDLNMAVQILDRNSGYFLSGNNTQIDGFSCHWKLGENKIKILFENCNLNHGSIELKALLFQYVPGNNLILDECIFPHNRMGIMVDTPNASTSMLYFTHKWEIN